MSRFLRVRLCVCIIRVLFSPSLFFRLLSPRSMFSMAVIVAFLLGLGCDSCFWALCLALELWNCVSGACVCVGGAALFYSLFLFWITCGRRPVFPLAMCGILATPVSFLVLAFGLPMLPHPCPWSCLAVFVLALLPRDFCLALAHFPPFCRTVFARGQVLLFLHCSSFYPLRSCPLLRDLLPVLSAMLRFLGPQNRPPFL